MNNPHRSLSLKKGLVFVNCLFFKSVDQMCVADL